MELFASRGGTKGDVDFFCALIIAAPGGRVNFHDIRRMGETAHEGRTNFFNFRTKSFSCFLYHKTVLCYLPNTRRLVMVSTKELAAMLGIKFYKVYYAERIGKIPKPQRKMGTTNVYTEEEAAAVRTYFMSKKKGKK